MIVRTLDEGDVDFAVMQAVREGWTPAATWFELFLALDPRGSFILEHRGAPAGMVTTTRYEKTAWIGYLIVPPGHRRQGFGTRLMKHALDHLGCMGIGTVRLDADPPGIGIYRRLGFLEEFQSLRFCLDEPAVFTVTSAVAMTSAHLEAIGRLDQRAFGDDRSRLLRLLVDRAEAGFVVERRGLVAGFAFVVRTTAGVHIGPMVAEDEGVARELWGAALVAARWRRISTGIPAPNRAGCTVLRSLGFSERKASVRMVRGPAKAGGEVNGIFAVGSGAFG